MNNNKQTSVEWLIEQIKNDHNEKCLTELEWIKIFEQAKEMHKEELIEAWMEAKHHYTYVEDEEETHNEWDDVWDGIWEQGEVDPSGCSGPHANI